MMHVRMIPADEWKKKWNHESREGIVEHYSRKDSLFTYMHICIDT